MKKYCKAGILMLIVSSAKTQILISILLGDKLNLGKMEFGLEGGVNWLAIKSGPAIFL